MTIYTNQELQIELSTLTGWSHVNDAIEKHFQFKNFKEALGFILQVGFLAEEGDHHPEIFNVYNKVMLRLNTHSANAITNKDIELARQINHL